MSDQQIKQIQMQTDSMIKQSQEQHPQRKNHSTKLPQTYFDLIEKVGSKGKYQRNFLFIILVIWFAQGASLMNAGFYYLNKDFDCSANGLLTQDCDVFVCKLPQQLRAQYVSKSQNYIQSMATEFGPYYCEDQFYLNIFQSLTFAGALMGYLVFSFVSDNYGRKKTMVIGWSIAILGYSLIVFAQNIYMAIFGVIVSGFGGDACTPMTIYFINQTVQDQKRQKYSTMIQIMFGVGVLTSGGMYFFIPNWRWNTVIVCYIPIVICFFFLVTYVQQSPQFLIKKGVPATLKALNRIGKINFKIQNILTQKDVEHVIKFHQIQPDKQIDNQTVNYLDLFRFPSLRYLTISLFFFDLLNYIMYVGPIFLIDEVGFNVIASSLVIELSELIAIIPSYYVIQKLPRKKTGMYSYLICTILAASVIFQQKPSDCNGECWQLFFQLFIVFVFRFFISFYYNLVTIYYGQLYPSRVRALGGGAISFGGTIGGMITPYLIGLMISLNSSPMIMHTIIGPLLMAILLFLRQTKDVPLQQQIFQIRMLLQQKAKRQNEDSIVQKFN